MPLLIDEAGKGAFKSYSVLDGLPSDVLLSIREDDKHNLWISTENGVSKFIPGEERFENYDDRSITFRVRFSEAASTVTSKGDILFGASNGIFMFNPDSISKVGLDDTKELVLSHKENIFAIQYAALDYTNPQNIQYAYILEGFEKQWTYADRLRSATYTNLPKGHYTFKVRSTNSDGVWVPNTRYLCSGLHSFHHLSVEARSIGRTTGLGYKTSVLYKYFT